MDNKVFATRLFQIEVSLNLFEKTNILTDKQKKDITRILKGLQKIRNEYENS